MNIGIHMPLLYLTSIIHPFFSRQLIWTIYHTVRLLMQVIYGKVLIVIYRLG